jgi:hypothetical protein
VVTGFWTLSFSSNYRGIDCSKMSDYGNPDYWDERYQKEDTTFDWLESYETLKPLIEKCAPDRNAKILILGCGNAEMSEDMYRDGYRNLENIDISGVVIQ